jgi:hypothetical protein
MSLPATLQRSPRLRTSEDRYPGSLTQLDPINPKWRIDMSLRKRYGDANANTLCPGPLKDCPAISCTIVHLLSHRLRLGLWEQFATFKVTLAGLRQVGAATTMCRPSASHNTRFAHNAHSNHSLPHRWRLLIAQTLLGSLKVSSTGGGHLQNTGHQGCLFGSGGRGLVIPGSHREAIFPTLLAKIRLWGRVEPGAWEASPADNIHLLPMTQYC